jgi:pyrroline-5-carboxylate reductase
MIGFVGGGKMAEALIKGLVSHGNSNICVSDRLEERRCFLERTYNIKTTAMNADVVALCDLIILAVKPQDMPDLLDEITSVVTEKKVIVSIAAGLTLDFFKKKLRTKKIIRVMPNIPVIVQEGFCAMSFDDHVDSVDIALVTDLISTVGSYAILPEEQMNAISALSGCGPAFISLFVESLIHAGGQMGIDKDVAHVAAVQTLVGTAKLICDGMSPEALRVMVTSPGGMTAAGLADFEKNGLKDIVVQALCAAQKKGVELGNK